MYFRSVVAKLPESEEIASFAKDVKTNTPAPAPRQQQQQQRGSRSGSSSRSGGPGKAVEQARFPPPPQPPLLQQSQRASPLPAGAGASASASASATSTSFPASTPQKSRRSSSTGNSSAASTPLRRSSSFGDGDTNTNNGNGNGSSNNGLNSNRNRPRSAYSTPARSGGGGGGSSNFGDDQTGWQTRTPQRTMDALYEAQTPRMPAFSGSGGDATPQSAIDIKKRSLALRLLGSPNPMSPGLRRSRGRGAEGQLSWSEAGGAAVALSRIISDSAAGSDESVRKTNPTGSIIASGVASPASPATGAAGAASTVSEAIIDGEKKEEKKKSRKEGKKTKSEKDNPKVAKLPPPAAAAVDTATMDEGGLIPGAATAPTPAELKVEMRSNINRLLAGYTNQNSGRDGGGGPDGGGSAGALGALGAGAGAVDTDRDRSAAPAVPSPSSKPKLFRAGVEYNGADITGGIYDDNNVSDGLPSPPAPIATAFSPPSSALTPSRASPRGLGRTAASQGDLGSVFFRLGAHRESYLEELRRHRTVQTDLDLLEVHPDHDPEALSVQTTTVAFAAGLEAAASKVDVAVSALDHVYVILTPFFFGRFFFLSPRARLNRSQHNRDLPSRGCHANCFPVYTCLLTMWRLRPMLVTLYIPLPCDVTKGFGTGFSTQRFRSSHRHAFNSKSLLT